MANRINNKYDYRSGLLDSLNVQHNASDVRNEDEYRKKVLNGLGVEFTDDDINQKSRYRAKVVEGLASSGGGGGSSDISTAQVTMHNTTENYEETPFAYLEGDVLHMESIPIPTEEKTFTIPLYKGHAQIPYSSLYTLGGNAEAKGSGLYRYIDITGACTITIS